jgi:hypothetical protein
MSEEVQSDLKFEEAIAFTESLLHQTEAGELSPEAIGEAIATLVQTENGARGFFVTYLTANNTLADYPSEEVVQALRSNPEIVSELLVKNLAMSAAMTLTHRRDENEPMAQDSERVRDRTATLIKLVELDEIRDRCKQLLESAVTGAGNYQAFLDRWGYDAEQRQLICRLMESLIGDKTFEETEGEIESVIGSSTTDATEAEAESAANTSTDATEAEAESAANTSTDAIEAEDETR